MHTNDNGQLITHKPDLKSLQYHVMICTKVSWRGVCVKVCWCEYVWAYLPWATKECQLTIFIFSLKVCAAIIIIVLKVDWCLFKIIFLDIAPLSWKCCVPYSAYGMLSNFRTRGHGGQHVSLIVTDCHHVNLTSKNKVDNWDKEEYPVVYQTRKSHKMKSWCNAMA